MIYTQSSSTMMIESEKGEGEKEVGRYGRERGRGTRSKKSRYITRSTESNITEKGSNKRLF